MCVGGGAWCEAAYFEKSVGAVVKSVGRKNRRRGEQSRMTGISAGGRFGGKVGRERQQSTPVKRRASGSAPGACVVRSAGCVVLGVPNKERKKKRKDSERNK